MINGIFTKGENVEALKDGKRVAIFRITQPDHKKGDINSPSLTFNANPFDTSSSLGTSYSASSTVLNVDVNAVADEAKEHIMDISQQVEKLLYLVNQVVHKQK